MSDAQSHSSTDKKDGQMAIVVYVLNLAGLLLPLLVLIGLVMAYVLRGDNPNWVESHYRFQIRSFWMGLLAFFTAVFLFLLGVLINSDLVTLFFSLFVFAFFLAIFLWWIVRAARGLGLAAKGKAIPDAASWGIGG